MNREDREDREEKNTQSTRKDKEKTLGRVNREEKDGKWGSVTKGKRYQAQIFFFTFFPLHCKKPWKILNHYYRILEMFNSFLRAEERRGEEREGDRRWSEIV